MCAKLVKEGCDEELDAVFKKSQNVLHNAGLFISDRRIYTLIDSTKYLHPEQQEWSFGVEQQGPGPPHNDVEDAPETLAIKQEEQETDIAKFPLIVVIVKSEDDDKGDVSEELHFVQQDWNFRVEQQEPQHMKDKEKPELPHIKLEEQEEDMKLLLTLVPVKIQDEEVKGQSEENRGTEPLSSSSSQHMTTESDGDHWRGSQANGLFAPLSDCDNIMSRSSDTDDEHSKGDMTCHTDNKRVKCSQCDKTFFNKSSLKRHMRTHTGEKPYRCSDCGKRFSQKADLNIHIGGKRFACSFCPLSFSKRCNLITHTRTHTGEKPFACSDCSLSFSVRSALAQHMKTHTGEKPFSCSVCGKRFTQSSNLTTHIRSHTGEKPFSCSVCDKQFTYKYQMNKHKCAGEKRINK
ncbi:zinc finger protein 771-like isoform X1 [Phycodurus eques]|uniref:zinc finger protein 771-like isoform X1 n=1 Tax=Phycodurus eques TaxID=693459 RepID=UPI002ACE5502|nr:zinc finger protein 771-like isoform X1 [Phycodurus eques]